DRDGLSRLRQSQRLRHALDSAGAGRLRRRIPARAAGVRTRRESLERRGDEAAHRDPIDGAAHRRTARSGKPAMKRVAGIFAVAVSSVLGVAPAQARMPVGIEAHGGWSWFTMGAVNDSLSSLNDNIGTRLDPFH